MRICRRGPVSIQLVAIGALVAALAAVNAEAADALPGVNISAPRAPDPDDINQMSMLGAFGPYSMNREASGTAWQPDSSPSEGGMTMSGDWMLMAHGALNGVYDRQRGPRGGEKAFVSGMLMGMATRSLSSSDTVQLRVMLSPDPPMGKGGYPLLLASGETANGLTHLIDRQHPHDLFMELSASYSHAFSDRSSIFVYAGLPGEPAFGPPAFMHRLSAMDSPEAPISHHWLDSTHVTFGVLTGGFIYDTWKFEASSFNGREPDQERYNIEAGRLDSISARLSWNPTSNLSLQSSWATLRDPEQLDPGVNQRRWTASAIYTQPIGAIGWWSTTAAWGQKTSRGETLQAYALETALHPNSDWTLFGRAEQVQNGELLGAPGPAYRVSKLSAGVIRDFPVNDGIRLGLGALYSTNFVPTGLKAQYGDSPDGGMAFVRLKFGAQ